MNGERIEKAADENETWKIIKEISSPREEKTWKIRDGESIFELN